MIVVANIQGYKSKYDSVQIFLEDKDGYFEELKGAVAVDCIIKNFDVEIELDCRICPVVMEDPDKRYRLSWNRAAKMSAVVRSFPEIRSIFVGKTKDGGIFLSFVVPCDY